MMDGITKGGRTLSTFDNLVKLLSSNKVSRNQTILEQHSHDESYHTPRLPDAVVFPESVADVVTVVDYARETRTPIVAFGAGTSLEGHVVPVNGGISLDMSRMNRVLDIRPDDLVVHVEAGVTRLKLEAELRRHGLFFPVDPGADATLGGMASTNASGTTTVRYGAMRDNVRQLEVVMADGKVITAGSRTAKSSSGYQLAPLFVGSEGTLGIITSLWLRVHGRPEAIVAAAVEFPTLEAAIRASTAMVGAGVAVARVEFVETPYLDAVNRFRGTSYSLTPTLFLEVHGSEPGVMAELSLAETIANDEGCLAFAHVREEEARNRLWEARHNALLAFMAQYPAHRHMSTDVCVPLSQLPEAIAHARQALDELGVKGAIIGHVGDGNFHVSIAFRPEDEDESKRVLLFGERVVTHALAVGGTCTGEHGVGIGKRRYQAQEHGDALAVMRALKATLDPFCIMNPGKLVDP